MKRLSKIAAIIALIALAAVSVGAAPAQVYDTDLATPIEMHERDNSVLEDLISAEGTNQAIADLMYFLVPTHIFTSNTGWTARMVTAHVAAETARMRGLPEDDPIIVECQRIWTEENNPKMTPIGTMRITGYDVCYQCCGKVDGITASGTVATVGRTIATSQFAFGTRIYIEGLGTYTVEDRGPSGNVIDVLCNNHSECHAITGFYQCYIVER